MIVLCLGKKGSGKSALLRKLIWRGICQRSVVFVHEAQCAYNPRFGKVYTSTEAWRRDPKPALLSIFRQVEVEDVARLALRVRDVTVALDEADRACRDKKWLSESVKRIVHEGRHYRVSLLGTFRRTANVSEDLISQCDYAFLFRQSSASPTDLQTVRMRFGQGVAEAVQTLAHGQFVVWQDN